MVISPNDFSLWSRLTGNKYPSTPKERAQKGPEVHNFIQNLGREGMLEGKENKEEKKDSNLGKKIAKGALIAAGTAATIAAARDPRVQETVKRAASATRNKIDDFLVNLGRAQKVDVDIVDASGDVTPDPAQQQSNTAPTQKEQRNYDPYWDTEAGKEELLDNEAQSAFLRSPEGKDMARREEYNQQKGIDYDYLNEVEAWKDNYKKQKTSEINRATSIPTTATTVEDKVNKFLSDVTPETTQKSLPEGPGLIERVGQKKAAMADTFKPAVEGETFQTSGAISKDDTYSDIGDATLRARRTFRPTLDALKEMDPSRKDLGRMGRNMLTQAQQDRDFDIAYIDARNRGLDDTSAVMLARETAGFDGTAAVRKPTEYRKLLGTLKTSSPLKPRVDDLINLVETGQRIKLPEGVQEGGALVQIAPNNKTPDNKSIKVGATIGGPTLTDQHATEMAVDNVLDNARDAYEKQVSTIVEAGKTKGGSISTADRAERFLQRAKPDVVKNYEAAIEQDLEKTTGLNPEDASNIAGSIINPITGQREVSSVQKSGSKIAVKGATRSPFNERSIPNIDPETNQGTIKTAVGTAVRGRAPSYDQAKFVERTREDMNDAKGGTLPDIQGGISGPSAQELLERKSGELMQYTGKRPPGEVAGRDEETKLLGDRAPRTPVRRVISPAADQGDSGPGVGIYGEGTGYLPGPFSSTAEKAPTDTSGKTSPFKGVSDSTLTKLKSDMKPGTKSFESVDREQRGRASMDAARELRKIQTSGDPSTANERVAKFLDNLKKQQGG